MDVRGGGRDADMERVTREDGYGSDNEVDSRNDASWNAQRLNTASKPLMNRSIAAIQSQASCQLHAQSFYGLEISYGSVRLDLMMSFFVTQKLAC